MKIFKLAKRKSMKERKLALIHQINQINNELYNIGRLDNRDYIYASVQAIEAKASSQLFGR